MLDSVVDLLVEITSFSAVVFFFGFGVVLSLMGIGLSIVCLAYFLNLVGNLLHIPRLIWDKSQSTGGTFGIFIVSLFFGVLSLGAGSACLLMALIYSEY